MELYKDEKKIMPRFSFITALLFLSSACFADDPEKNDCSSGAKKTLSLNDGFYLGIGGGYSWCSVQRNVHATILGDSLFRETTFVNPDGFMGTLFVGYGHFIKERGYLGAELFSNLTGIDKKISTTIFQSLGEFTYKTKTSTNFSYGVSLLPGYKVNDCSLIYLRLGFVRARFKEKEKESLLNAPNGAPFLQTTLDRYTNGCSYGFGFEEAVYWRLSLRAEFSRTSYWSFGNTYTSFVSSTTAKLQPSTNQFTLSLIWKIW
jgi:opacity protein-like surface antigen